VKLELRSEFWWGNLFQSDQFEGMKMDWIIYKRVMELGHLLTHSDLTCLEVSPCFCYQLVCVFFFLSILGNLIRGIMFICCNHFLMYSCILSKSGVIFGSFAICVFFYNLSKRILLLFSYISSLLPLFFWRLSPALVVQFSLPCNRAGKASVLYSFIQVFFQVFCALHLL